jgi:hypothetical protein
MHGFHRLPGSRDELAIIVNVIQAYVTYLQRQPRTKNTRYYITTLQDVRTRIQSTLKANTTDWVVPLSVEEQEAVQRAIVGFMGLLLAYLPQSAERDQITSNVQSLQHSLTRE